MPAQPPSRGFSSAECQDAWDGFFIVRALGFGAVASIIGGLILAAHVLGSRYALGGVSRQTLTVGALIFGAAAIMLLGGGTLKYAFGPESGWNTWFPAGLAAGFTSSAYMLVARAANTRRELISG